MNVSALPNLITVLRICLVGPMVWFLSQARYKEAMVIFIVAGLSDALDGLLARHYNWMSRLGAALDPAADKLLVLGLIVILTLQEHIPLWLAVIVVGRDLVILAGAAVYRLWFQELTFEPTFVSKANTAVQVVTFALLLIGLAYPTLFGGAISRLVDPYAFFLLAALALVSGADYVVKWSRKAAHQSRMLERG